MQIMIMILYTVVRPQGPFTADPRNLAAKSDIGAVEVWVCEQGMQFIHSWSIK
jgi:hypothetical protein